MANLKVTVPENSQNILGTVTINAPLAKVFEAYVKEDLFASWWCRGNPMKVYHFNCQDGGSWHIAEQSEGGHEYEFTGCFHEVTQNTRIVQTFEFLGMPERGHVMLEKAEFIALDGQTTEIRTQSTAMSQADRDEMVASGMESGWRQSITALGTLLESGNEAIVNKTIFTKDAQAQTMMIERIFAAPQSRVWKALTDSSFLDQWWAPQPWQAQTHSFEFREGGHWHYSMNGPEGEKHWGWIDYLAIDPENSFSMNDAFVDENGSKNLDMPMMQMKTTLEPLGSSTKVVVLTTFASLADMEKVIEMGFEEGFTAAQDQLEALLGNN